MGPSFLRVTEHAVRRLQVHLPKATAVTVRELVAEAEPLSAELVGALTRQWSRAKGDDDYRLHRGTDGWGIFVLTGDTVVTYLRLSPLQVHVLGGRPAALFSGTDAVAEGAPSAEPLATAPPPAPAARDAASPWRLFKAVVERELDARLRMGPDLPRNALAEAFLAGAVEGEPWGWLVTLPDGRRFRVHRRGNGIDVEAVG